eukprot:2880516-Amphidinium_carterae.1
MSRLRLLLASGSCASGRYDEGGVCSDLQSRLCKLAEDNLAKLASRGACSRVNKCLEGTRMTAGKAEHHSTVERLDA